MRLVRPAITECLALDRSRPGRLSGVLGFKRVLPRDMQHGPIENVLDRGG